MFHSTDVNFRLPGNHFLDELSGVGSESQLTHVNDKGNIRSDGDRFYFLAHAKRKIDPAVRAALGSDGPPVH
jgi:hypothetical protein